MSSPPPVEDGETLVPTVADVLLSFACLPASPHIISTYTQALSDQLRPGVDMCDVLNKVNQQHLPNAKVVSTLNRPLVFSCTGGHQMKLKTLD